MQWPGAFLTFILSVLPSNRPLGCRQSKPIGGAISHPVLKELEETLEIMVPRHSS